MQLFLRRWLLTLAILSSTTPPWGMTLAFPWEGSSHFPLEPLTSLHYLCKERDGHRYQSHSIYFRCTPLSSFCECTVSCSQCACVCVFSWAWIRQREHIRTEEGPWHRTLTKVKKICAGYTVSPVLLVKGAIVLQNLLYLCFLTISQLINSSKSNLFLPYPCRKTHKAGTQPNVMSQRALITLLTPPSVSSLANLFMYPAKHVEGPQYRSIKKRLNMMFSGDIQSSLWASINETAPLDSREKTKDLL